MNIRSIGLAITLLAVSATAWAQTGHLGHPINDNLIFPHIALGGGYLVDVVLLAPGQTVAPSGTLYLFRTDGSPWPVVFGGQTVTSVPVNLPPGGSAYVGLGPVGDSIEVGWALFEVEDGGGMNDHHKHVFGSVIYTYAPAGQTAGKVGVIASRYSMGNFLHLALPVMVGGTVNTGVAAVNSGASAATFTFRLKNAAGVVVRNDATIQPPLQPFAPGNQLAMFVPQLFPDVDFSDFKGSLEIDSAQEGLVVTGLLTDGALLTAIPAVQVPQDMSMPQTHTVTNAGFEFSPDSLEIAAGDTVVFDISTAHNVVEVTQSTWNANGNTPKGGGFSLPFGGGEITLNTPGTYYYVCSVHAGGGMKGRITVN